MLAAVVNEANTLKAASIIVEVLTDLLSAKTRFWIKASVAVLFPPVLVCVWYVGVAAVPLRP
jgi:hypothetical protein